MQAGLDKSREKVILLVEDSAADVMLLKEAFSQINSAGRLIVVKDGGAALQYLSGLKPYSDRTQFPLPDLVLLDLGLPILDGFHVLEWIRTEPYLGKLPVVILTASNRPEDLNRAYAFGANSFITKCPNRGKLVADLKTALDYWLGATNQFGADYLERPQAA